MKWYWMIGALLVCSCKEKLKQTIYTNTTPVIPAITLRSDNLHLKLLNGQWFYHDTLFSGRLEDFYTSGILKSRQSFYKGREEGWLIEWFESGQRASQRYYRTGEKEGVHKGWWENGMPRFAYHFSSGKYHGDFSEWMVNGRLAKQIIYKDGNEVSGKAWRDNGKLYMSFEVRGGRRYGLMNAKPCYSLKSEK